MYMFLLTTRRMALLRSLQKLKQSHKSVFSFLHGIHKLETYELMATLLDLKTYSDFGEIYLSIMFDLRLRLEMKENIYIITFNQIGENGLS